LFTQENEVFITNIDEVIHELPINNNGLDFDVFIDIGEQNTYFVQDSLRGKYEDRVSVFFGKLVQLLAKCLVGFQQG
jgi:hypothetical protein